ncbi:hypothetical protein GCM10023185_33320 [Hymenobacter saemangeumensis]|uniref:DUF6602 domain-containing protein n=1 Tax=Hymenobacter saemangeumensis TaxID=1084522 RepID=A0ABP8INT9_9BACT
MLSKEDLQRKVSFVEKQMLLKLEEIRASFEHKGIKGTAVENELREFLRSYLPRRMAIGTGEVIDREFRTSNQMDVVIASEDHPFTFRENDPGLFFVEGVCAVGEVKAILNTEQLLDSLAKGSNYKQLVSIPPANAMMSANESDGKRFYTTPPFFLFAFESQITLEKIAEVVQSYRPSEYKPGFTIDGIFVLSHGYLIDLGDGQGAFNILNSDRTCSTGWRGQHSDLVLFDFLGWLSTVMPRMVGGSNILTPYLLKLLR